MCYSTADRAGAHLKPNLHTTGHISIAHLRGTETTFERVRLASKKRLGIVSMYVRSHHSERCFRGAACQEAVNRLSQACHRAGACIHSGARRRTQRAKYRSAASKVALGLIDDVARYAVTEVEHQACRCAHEGCAERSAVVCCSKYLNVNNTDLLSRVYTCPSRRWGIARTGKQHESCAEDHHVHHVGHSWADTRSPSTTTQSNSCSHSCAKRQGHTSR